MAAAPPPPLFLLLDGRSGSGKSSLAAALLAELGRAGVHAVRADLEDVYPGWHGLQPAVATTAGEIVPALAARRPASFRLWDWETSRPSADTRTVEPADVVLLEGVGASSRPLVRAAAAAGAEALTVWIGLDPEARKARALERDGDTFAPYWDLWAAEEDAWLASPDAPGPADVEVEGGAPSAADLAAVLAALRPSGPLGPVLREAWRETGSGTVSPSDGAALSGLFAELSAGTPHAAWLDSSLAEPGPRNRRTVMAAGRLGVDFAREPGAPGRLHASAAGVRGRRTGDFFPWLSEAWAGPWGGSGPSAVPQGRGGAEAGGGLRSSAPAPLDVAWIAQLGYELRAECGTPDIPRPESADRDARLFWPSRLLVLDVATGAWQRFERGAASGPAGPSVASPAPSRCSTATAPSSSFTAADPREGYLAKIEAAQREIRAGNSYEVCLTTALEAEAHPDPLELFGALRAASPAPFGALLRMGRGSAEEFSLVSSSPERFLSVDADGVATAEPIKGTRPRGADAAEDARLRAELAGSAKDRAENIMIVDLLRNDLGAAAETGSVRVSRLCDIEEYATVFQMVSTVTARVRPELPRGELLRAAFPPGSMTGCPKISTMDILHSLEGRRRGAYSGAVGFLAWDGSADLSVVIRSLEVSGGRMRLGLGGAITVDSEPAAEWDEVRAKSRGVLRALGAEFPEA
ncbi:chorismate-binding protein [Arthrobacter sp. UM1]|uniref:chorismate-binding protein n=1 Tax=Arthrobacter sp. UM1 TaxID=2766776 RepID=UPI001CF6413A|nr:chorismate-binding protein [Arthrobacter sp. UM1]MCB4208445.1 chorismate-binding protein [Arthrobacter sp. UM1]